MFDPEKPVSSWARARRGLRRYVLKFAVMQWIKEHRPDKRYVARKANKLAEKLSHQFRYADFRHLPKRVQEIIMKAFGKKSD